MASKTKSIGAAGRFGPRAGVRVRNRLNPIELIQRKRQVCPHCAKAGVVRESAGVWHCKKCGKRFAGHAYMLERQV